MSRSKSLLKSLGMARWFFSESWSYMDEYRVEFFVGVIPAWIRFTKATYLDCRLANDE